MIWLNVPLALIGVTVGLLATGQPHKLAEPFQIGRFRHLEFVSESGTTTAR